MNFHGPVQGANIAGSRANISGSTAAYNNNADLMEALKGLKPLIHEVAANQREAVTNALQVLIDASEKDIPAAQVAEAANAVSKASPTLGERLKDIGSKISLSLASSAIFQGIKSACGIP